MFKSPRAGLDVMKLSIIQKRNVLELILYLNGKQDIFIILINFSSRTKKENWYVMQVGLYLMTQ